MKPNIISPESSPGSFIYSVAVHVTIAVSVVFLLKINLSSPVVIPESTIELGYETFDRPPEPTKEVQHIRQVVQEEVPRETQSLPDNSVKELQDAQGVVSGTQAAAAPVKASSEGSGTAATTPYYKIKPKYPKAALVAGTEGWVMLKVDIKEDGSVENVRVVDGEQRNLFQSEAKRAVEQWKYRPFTNDDGKPFKKADHQVKVEFKLQDAG